MDCHESIEFFLVGHPGKLDENPLGTPWIHVFLTISRFLWPLFECLSVAFHAVEISARHHPIRPKLRSLKKIRFSQLWSKEIETGMKKYHTWILWVFFSEIKDQQVFLQRSVEKISGRFRGSTISKNANPMNYGIFQYFIVNLNTWHLDIHEICRYYTNDQQSSSLPSEKSA